MTMSVFKDFPGLENLEKKFKDLQGLVRALQNNANFFYLSNHAQQPTKSVVNNGPGPVSPQVLYLLEVSVSYPVHKISQLNPLLV